MRISLVHVSRGLRGQDVPPTLTTVWGSSAQNPNNVLMASTITRVRVARASRVNCATKTLTNVRLNRVRMEARVRTRWVGTRARVPLDGRGTTVNRILTNVPEPQTSATLVSVWTTREGLTVTASQDIPGIGVRTSLMSVCLCRV